MNNFAIIFSKSTRLYNCFSVSVSVYSLPGKNAAIEYIAKIMVEGYLGPVYMEVGDPR